MILSERDQAFLTGEFGAAGQMAMRIMVAMAGVYGADRLLDIESAHIDGCLYHGDSGIDFAEKLIEGGAKVIVPTTLNVGAIDLMHPEYFQGSAEQAQKAAHLMKLYEQMGCRPIWTCTPYQTTQRPDFGAQIAWAESNAIVFANSVLGARTNRYGDYIDICAAITGRAPAFGLHLTENRRGQIIFRLQNIPDRLLTADVFYPVLGYLVGSLSAEKIPIIDGLPPDTTEDQLKALGASSASSGAVPLFHVVGRTPEAPTLADALHHQPADQTIDVTLALWQSARAKLSTVPDGLINVVALGSPHFSHSEFGQLFPLLNDYTPNPTVEFIICTNRFVLAQLQRSGRLAQLRELNIQVMVDSCIVVAPFVRAQSGVLMTNSGKFAHYTPGNTGLQVIFGSLEECVRSAENATVWRDPTFS